MARKKRSLGYGFPDEVAKVTFEKRRFKKGETFDWKDLLLPNFDQNFEREGQKDIWRVTAAVSLCLILFAVMLMRLFHLQIFEGVVNRRLADGNRIAIKLIHAPRGVIFDRNGRVLASNSPAFRLLSSESKKARLISREEALELEVKNDPGFYDLEIDHVRSYHLGEKLAHVLGYVGEISQELLESREFQDYKLGDRIGIGGVEDYYEHILKGVDGGEIIEVDSLGRKIRTIRKDLPRPGQNIYLTIDANLQEKVYQMVEDTLTRVGSCCGAAVALDPASGQILSLVSLPSFNPDIFTRDFDESAIANLLTDQTAPILNRVIGGTYPPGSTFKIVSSLAALDSGKINPNTIFYDNGVIYLGTFKFTNWYFNQYGKTEGAVNLKKALQRSNDTYFYEVARITGEKPIGQWAKKLNLGQKLGIDLAGEIEGLVPNDEWKRRTFGEGWYPGDTLHLVIGQGFILTTPLQILGMTSFVAQNGTLYKPQLVLKTVYGNSITSEFKPKALLAHLVSQDRLNSIKEGLELVPKTGGTAWPFFTFPIPTAGKTGTAEYGDPKGRVHAWYTGYAPADDPKIAMTVLIEGGGEGSSVAAPIVKETFRWYFSEDKNKLIQDVYIPATESAKPEGE